MRTSITLKITGRVQGVFYRQSSKEKALQLGISGTTRNLNDGSVFIEAEGTQEQLEMFCSWCKIGPPMSKVEQVEIHEALCKNFSSFEILH